MVFVEIRSINVKIGGCNLSLLCSFGCVVDARHTWAFLGHIIMGVLSIRFRNFIEKSNENHIFVIFQWNFEIESITSPLLCTLERLTYAVRQLHNHMSIIEWGYIHLFDINGPNFNEHHISVILKWNFEIESITPLLLCALERLTYAVRQLHSHMSIIEWGLHPPILTLMDRISTKTILSWFFNEISKSNRQHPHYYVP